MGFGDSPGASHSSFLPAKPYSSLSLSGALRYTLVSPLALFSISHSSAEVYCTCGLRPLPVPTTQAEHQGFLLPDALTDPPFFSTESKTEPPSGFEFFWLETVFHRDSSLYFPVRPNILYSSAPRALFSRKDPYHSRLLMISPCDCRTKRRAWTLIASPRGLSPPPSVLTSCKLDNFPVLAQFS